LQEKENSKQHKYWEEIPFRSQQTCFSSFFPSLSSNSQKISSEIGRSKSFNLLGEKGDQGSEFGGFEIQYLSSVICPLRYLKKKKQKKKARKKQENFFQRFFFQTFFSRLRENPENLEIRRKSECSIQIKKISNPERDQNKFVSNLSSRSCEGNFSEKSLKPVQLPNDANR